jgi:hypothetical protein
MTVAARVTTAAEGLPRPRFTVAEVEAMVAAGVVDGDERLELIGGELVPMSPKGIRARRCPRGSRDHVPTERRHRSRTRCRDLPARDRD